MAEARATTELIERIYACSLQPDTWDEAVKDIAIALGADAALAYLPGRALGTDDYARDAIGWNVLSIDEARKIALDTGRRDAFIEGGMAKGVVKPGAIAVGQQLCDDRRWDENPWSELAYKPIDVRHYMGFVAEMPPQLASTLHFSLFRRPTGTSFRAADLLRLERLRLHIERAGRMAFRIRAEVERNHLLRSLSDAQVEPTMVIDETGKVVECNLSAQTMLRDGRQLRSRHGRIEGCNAAASDGLSRALRSAARLTASEVWLTDVAGQPFFCALSPMQLTDGRRGALLIIEARSHPDLQARFARLFGLTAAEFEVMQSLIDGRSASETADLRGVNIGTVRAQLRSIFFKTDVDTQARLVALAARLSRVGLRNSPNTRDAS